MPTQIAIPHSSRIASQIARHQQTQRLRHLINALASRLPENERTNPQVRVLLGDEAGDLTALAAE
jgi:NTE family protein